MKNLFYLGKATKEKDCKYTTLDIRKLMKNLPKWLFQNERNYLEGKIIFSIIYNNYHKIK